MLEKGHGQDLMLMMVIKPVVVVLDLSVISLSNLSMEQGQ